MIKAEAIQKVRLWAQFHVERQQTTHTAAAAMKERDDVLGFLETNLPESRQPDSPELRDTDPMPWGKYKGVQMQEVPASYMFWLWTAKGFENEDRNHWNPVAEYIRRNLDAFEKDYPDGIWRK